MNQQREARSASNRSIGVGFGPSNSDREAVQLLIDRLSNENVFPGRFLDEVRRSHSADEPFTSRKARPIFTVGQ